MTDGEWATGGLGGVNPRSQAGCTLGGSLSQKRFDKIGLRKANLKAVSKRFLHSFLNIIPSKPLYFIQIFGNLKY